MKPHIGIGHRGGAALLVAVLTSTLAAHVGPAPRLTPTPAITDASAVTPSRADRSFMRRAAMSVSRLVAVSQAVMERLSNPQLKSFAQQVITDDTVAGSDLAALAGLKGVELPAGDETPPSLDGSRKTADVDRQYLVEMVSDQEDAARLFEDASASGDPDVAAFAQKALSTLRRQLAAARAFQTAFD